MPVGAIVKSLVFTADGAPVLVLASGDHQVDTAAVAALLGVERVRRADPEMVRSATGFPIGGVAPVATRRRYRPSWTATCETFDGDLGGGGHAAHGVSRRRTRSSSG